MEINKERQKIERLRDRIQNYKKNRKNIKRQKIGRLRYRKKDKEIGRQKDRKQKDRETESLKFNFYFNLVVQVSKTFFAFS